MDTIVLLKNFTIALDPGQAFFTDWARFPANHKNADLHMHTQTMIPTSPSTGLSYQLQASFDTVEEVSAGTSTTVAGVGSQALAISSGLATMVRIRISSADSVPITSIVSVYLQPKSD